MIIRATLLLLALALSPTVQGPAVAQRPGTSHVPPAANVLPETVAPERLAELRLDLQRLLAPSRASGARHGLLVVSLDRGDTLFAHDPDLPLSPASNMKLYTTAAALYYLGPDFRYSTSLLADGEIRNGVLRGDLVLAGTGDPSISERLLPDAMGPWDEMARALASLGVREVTGDLIGDGSWFDDETHAPQWEEDDRLAWYAAPVGALSFAENMITLRVLPGRAAGEPARVRTLPATTGLALRSEVRTVSSGSTRIRVEHGADGLLLTGRIRRGHPGWTRRVPVADPANYAAAALRAVLEAQGIVLRGRTHTADRPPAALRTVATHLSPPLSVLAEVTNHVSHNLFAEALLKTIGRVVHGEGSFRAGARAVRGFVAAEVRTDPAALAVVDGSGLSRSNRASARAIVALLDHVSRSEVADVYVGSLPVAGSADGLRRMYGTPAAANLRAKSGTIRHVSALSGYVRAADGERLAFSILANGVPETWRAKQLEDAIGARLAAFTR